MRNIRILDGKMLSRADHPCRYYRAWVNERTFRSDVRKIQELAKSAEERKYDGEKDPERKKKRTSQ